MSETTQNTPFPTTTLDESTRQWWLQRFGSALPDDVRIWLRDTIRQEVVRMRHAEHHLDDATLLKVREGRRLCQAKLDDIGRSLDEIRASRQRIRRFLTLSQELEQQQSQLYELGKRQACILTQKNELERYEAFEAINGRFQRISTLTKSIEAARERQASIAIAIDEARRATDEAEKAMNAEQQQVTEAQEALAAAATNMAQSEQLTTHSEVYEERLRKADETHEHLRQRILRLRQRADELQGALQKENDAMSQLQLQRQALDAHSRLIAKGEGVQVMLDELSNVVQKGATIRAELAQAQARQRQRNEQLSQLYGKSQDIKSEIKSRNEEIQGHRTSMAGQDSYTLGRRVMELRSRLQMLQTGLSLWRSIAAGYDQIEAKQQLITQMRLRADHVSHAIDTLQVNVQTLRRQHDDKTYHWTLSKSQNVIELRGDLREGYPCTVCGATHHPWPGESIAQQNGLIQALKSDCDTLGEELKSKEDELRNLQTELHDLQGRLEVETDNLAMLRQRQKNDTDEWRTFSRLDSSFAECSPSTNREARTAMMRQLIEKTTIDAEDAEKALDAFNFHLNAINSISGHVEALQREAAELGVRLSEVNTACQVMAGQVERFSARLAANTSQYTRRYDILDKLITLPDWHATWEQSPESLRLRIQELMSQWQYVNENINKSTTHAAALTAEAQVIASDIEATVVDITTVETQQHEFEDIISKNRNAMERLLQGDDGRTLFAAARATLSDRQAQLQRATTVYNECLKRHISLEAQHRDIGDSIAHSEARISAERQELDIWMRRYNATHPPVQMAELERLLADGRDWSQTRSDIREITLQHATTEARVANLRAEIIALQAEGMPPLVGDGTAELTTLERDREALEQERRQVLTQMAHYDEQLHAHELT